jgi:hypothetical protein
MSGSRRPKGQIAFEYMSIFAIFMIALILASVFAWTRSVEITQAQRRLEVENLLDGVSGKIDTAWLEGEGFTTNLTIPETVADSQFTLNVTSNFLLLVLRQEEYVKPILTPNVTGSFTIGGVNTLYNRGDRIEIS